MTKRNHDTNTIAFADAVLHAACRLIQDRLGVTSGDVASHMFSDDTVRDAFADYIAAEIALLPQTSAESQAYIDGCDPWPYEAALNGTVDDNEIAKLPWKQAKDYLKWLGYDDVYSALPRAVTLS